MAYDDSGSKLRLDRWKQVEGELLWIPERIDRARQLMRPLAPGRPIIGFSWGTVGLIDLLRAGADLCGHGSECVISTFQMHPRGIAALVWMVDTGRIKSVKMLVDVMKFIRSPSLTDELMRITGGNVCVFKTHAKFFALRGPKGEMLCMSSANFSAAVRVENHCIFYGPGTSAVGFDLWDDCTRLMQVGYIPTPGHAERIVRDAAGTILDAEDELLLQEELALQDLDSWWNDET